MTVLETVHWSSGGRFELNGGVQERGAEAEPDARAYLLTDALLLAH